MYIKGTPSRTINALGASFSIKQVLGGEKPETLPDLVHILMDNVTNAISGARPHLVVENAKVQYSTSGGLWFSVEEDSETTEWRIEVKPPGKFYPYSTLAAALLLNGFTPDAYDIQELGAGFDRNRAEIVIAFTGAYRVPEDTLRRLIDEADAAVKAKDAERAEQQSFYEYDDETWPVSDEDADDEHYLDESTLAKLRESRLFDDDDDDE